MGASITLDTGESATTGSGGTYTISDAPTGSREVTASAIGYVSQTQSATVDNQVTTPGVDFTLATTPPGPTLSIAVTTDKPNYVNKETVQITVTVTDGANPVQGSAVSVEILTPGGKFVLAANATSNASGVATFTHKVNSKRDGEGDYTVNAKATLSGSDDAFGFIVFNATN